MSKKVVLSGYYGFKNFGDEAILSVLISKLADISADITVITSDPEYTKGQYSNIQTVKTFDLFNIIRSVKNADILISGGGSLLQDTTSLKSLMYYLFVIFTALFGGKKVIIFAQGIGPVKSGIGQFLTKFILKHCTYITVRDNQSALLLEKWGIKSDVVCDPIFSLPVKNIDKNHIVGIQLRNSQNMNELFLQNLANLLCENFSGYKAEIYSLQDSIDFEICEKFKSLIRDKLEVSLYCNMSQSDVVDRISACEYFIGMRFHSLIIALLSGVKSMAIDYDIKVEKLAHEFNLPLLDLQNADFECINSLKSLDLSRIEAKLKSKVFDWEKIITAINK